MIGVISGTESSFKNFLDLIEYQDRQRFKRVHNSDSFRGRHFESLILLYDWHILHDHLEVYTGAKTRVKPNQLRGQ